MALKFERVIYFQVRSHFLMNELVQFPGDDRQYRKVEYNPKMKHWILQCTCEVPRDDGTTFECGFKKREDCVKRDVARGKLHVCFPNNAKLNTILSYFNNPLNYTEAPLTFTVDGIFARLVIVLAKNNISLTAGESEEVYQLLLYTFATGYVTKKEEGKTPLEVAADKIPHHKRDKLKEVMITTASTVHEKVMKRFSVSYMPYVCVAIDEGSTMKRKLLDFVLENPNFPAPSYPAHTERLLGLKTVDYTVALSNGLREIHSKNIQIGCVVVDGGTAQWSALCGQRNSILQLSKHEWMKKIVVVPCVCHRLHNAYKFVLNSHAFEPLRQAILHIIDVCLANVKLLGAACPKLIETRWISMMAPLFFIKQHIAQVSQLCPIPDGFDELYQCTVIFASMVLLFEDSKTPLSRVFPVITNARNAFDELHRDGNRFAWTFQGAMLAKTLHSDAGGIWAFAYLTTPQGLLYARHLLNNREFPIPEKGYISLFRYKDEKKDPLDNVTEILIKDKVDELANQIPEPDNVKYPEHDLHPPDNLYTQQEQVSESVDETEAETSLTELDIVNHSIRFLQRELHKRGRSDEVIEDTIKAFKEMIANDSHPFKSMRTITGYDVFDFNFYLNDKVWNHFADIALRMCNCVCAEASCERTISAQRLILTCYNLNMSKETMDSRLKLMKGFQWKPK